MPLYEYQCPKCGRFELIRKFSDPPVTACPTCGSPVQKLASAPAFHLKGTGWYATDYAKKSGGADGKSSESKSSGKPDAKSDSASSDSGKSAAGDTAKSSSKETKDTSSATASKSKKSD